MTADRPADGQRAGVAVVTGGSRGVGRGVAIALGSHGYTVYVTGRTRTTGESPWGGTIGDTAAAITAAGGRGVAARVDHPTRAFSPSAGARSSPRKWRRSTGSATAMAGTHRRCAT